MTKTLTEQWCEGTLPQGYYYIVVNMEQKHRVIFYLPERNTEDEARLDLKDQFVLEVLAPVPRYDEYKELVSKTEQLEKRLEIATKALKGASFWANTGNGGEQAVKKVCDKALKEMEGVK